MEREDAPAGRSPEREQPQLRMQQHLNTYSCCQDADAPSDVCGNALQGHDCYRAGLLGDARLLNVCDVHDDTALQHLCESSLDGECSLLLLHSGRFVRVRLKSTECDCDSCACGGSVCTCLWVVFKLCVEGAVPAGRIYVGQRDAWPGHRACRNSA